MSSSDSGGSDGGERRRSPRIPIELKVEYRKLNTFFADYTKNLCRGGTFIRTPRPLDIGTEFLFHLVVPGFAAPIAVRGTVRWVVRDGVAPPEGVPSDHEHGMGIEFLYDSLEQRREIESTVEQMMRASLGDLLYEKLLGKDPGTPR